MMQMPLSNFKLNPDVPTVKACIDCRRRHMGCHGNCTDYAVDTITAVVAQPDMLRRKRTTYDMDEVRKSRIRKGLFE